MADAGGSGGARSHHTFVIKEGKCFVCTYIHYTEKGTRFKMVVVFQFSNYFLNIIYKRAILAMLVNKIILQFSDRFIKVTCCGLE